MAIQIVGFSPTNKLPGFFAETVYGSGAVSVADIPLLMLAVGMKTSAGSATANTDVLDTLSVDEADSLWGAGSQLSRMCYLALLEPGIKLKGAAVAEPGGAAGTATVTIAGSWTTTGDLFYYIDGVEVPVGITAAMTSVTLVAAAIKAAINANPRLPVTADNVAGLLTITRKNLGASGNDGALFQDVTKRPSGMTSTLAGGTAMAGGGFHFTGGSGTESATTLLTTLFPDWFDRIAVAANDATSAAAWELHVNNAAGVLEGRLQHLVFGHNGTLSAAITLAQTTLNAQRAQLVWYIDSETQPSEISARFCARRTAVEQVDPCAAYDGFVMTGVAPQRSRTVWPTTATLISALDSGVTPMATSRTGDAYIVRSITTKSLTGANPDYSCLDTSTAIMPDYIRRALQLEYETNVKPENPRVADDPAADAKERPAGVLTPARWNDVVKRVLADAEAATFLVDTALNPPRAEYNKTAKRIMGIVPVKDAPNNHSIGISVRSVA